MQIIFSCRCNKCPESWTIHQSRGCFLLFCFGANNASNLWHMLQLGRRLWNVPLEVIEGLVSHFHWIGLLLHCHIREYEGDCCKCLAVVGNTVDIFIIINSSHVIGVWLSNL